MNSKLLKLIMLLIALPIITLAQRYELAALNAKPNTSIRGLAVVNAKVIWVSGSNGFIGKSIDGGVSWSWTQPRGYEKLDFRDIQAVDANHAIVVNAGSPAFVLSTTDGGKSWVENYKNTDTAIFLDGMDFWDEKRGIIFGDPIANKMQLLRTNDCGKTWQNISENLKFTLQVGEAAFAASGTTIKTGKNGNVWIATGGKVSNIYHSKDYGNTWAVYPCAIVQGENSTGVFSLDFYNLKKGIVVGGNYLKDKVADNNVLLTNNGGKTWRAPNTPVLGYRSGVTYLNAKICVATGTSGTDISTDGGNNWTKVSNVSYNAVQAKDGLVILAGGGGKIAKLIVVQ